MDIQTVEGSRQFDKFIRFPFRLYATDPCWVPPLRSAEKYRLDPSRNPFFMHADVRLFLATDRKRVVGRIAAIENRRHDEVHGGRTGFWGFFETERNPAIATALLARAAEELRRRGMKQMIGPMNPSINDTVGLLVDGFHHPPGFLMPYNPPWYPAMVEASGQQPLKVLLAYRLGEAEIESERPAIQRLRHMAGIIHEKNPRISICALDQRRYHKQTRALHDLFNRARAGNWGFVPVTDAEFEAKAREMKPIVDPELVVIARVGSRIVGCLMALPDVSPLLQRCNGNLLPFGWLHLARGCRRQDSIRVFGAATEKAYRYVGVTPLLFHHLLLRACARGYRSAELSWVSEDNRASVKTIETAFDVKPYKRYRVYTAPL